MCKIIKKVGKITKKHKKALTILEILTNGLILKMVVVQ